MSSCPIIVDRCTCPYGNNKQGNLENFHDAADEITEEIIEEFDVTQDNQREI